MAIERRMGSRREKNDRNWYIRQRITCARFAARLATAASRSTTANTSRQPTRDAKLLRDKKFKSTRGSNTHATSAVRSLRSWEPAEATASHSRLNSQESRTQASDLRMVVLASLIARCAELVLSQKYICASPSRPVFDALNGWSYELPPPTHDERSFIMTAAEVSRDDRLRLSADQKACFEVLARQDGPARVNISLSTCCGHRHRHLWFQGVIEWTDHHRVSPFMLFECWLVRGGANCVYDFAYRYCMASVRDAAESDVTTTSALFSGRCQQSAFARGYRIGNSLTV